MLGESKDIIDYLQRKGTVQVEKCDAPESMYYTDTDSSVSQLERLFANRRERKRDNFILFAGKKKLTDSFCPEKKSSCPIFTRNLKRRTWQWQSVGKLST